MGTFLIISGIIIGTTVVAAAVSSYTSVDRIDKEIADVKTSIDGITKVATGVGSLKADLSMAKKFLDAGKILYDNGGLIYPNNPGCFVNSTLPDCQTKVDDAISSLEKTAQSLADRKSEFEARLTDLQNQRSYIISKRKTDPISDIDAA